MIRELSKILALAALWVVIDLISSFPWKSDRLLSRIVDFARAMQD